MRKLKFGILLLFAVLALVSVASAALPYSPVKASIASDYATSYFKVDVTSGVTPELPNGIYSGWCTDFDHGISLLTPYTFKAYSSLNASSFASGMPSAQWKKINYILNNKNADWKITQAAIWHYDGDSGALYPAHGEVSGYSHSAYDAYIATVDANGAKFVPSCGQLYAVILYKKGIQVVIVERPTPECHNAPEFPTLALPVAMVIGVVGAVQFVRTRKE
jgi:hypothetical protein